MNTRLKADLTRSRLRVHSRPFAVKKPIEVRSGSVAVRIYRTAWRDPKRGRTYESFTVAWRDASGRRREKRSSLEAAKARAEEIAIQIANGETSMLTFGQADRAAYLRALDHLRPTGKPIETAAAEYAEALALLAGAGSLVEAARYFAEKSRARTVSKTCPDIAAELLAHKRRQNKVGAKWLRALDAMLQRFSTHYTGPIHLLRAVDINAWLDNLQGGLVYRRHHRGAVRELVNYAIGRDYIPRDWDELRHVDDPDPAAVKIRIWQPGQLVSLLAAAPARMVPFITLQAFAGIRTEELVPAEKDAKAVPLDWSDIDLDARQIHVSQETGKTGERLVPISENLAIWLRLHARPAGPICTVKNTASALTRIKRRAGLPAGKGESRNVLRKSFISYRIGETSHRAQVAEEAGTSLSKIKSNYRRAATAGQAAQWFSILPTESEILQLDLFRRAG
jgi:integrase